MSEHALSLTEAADRLGWSRKTVVRKLVEHQIPTYGSGRLERITPANLEASTPTRQAANRKSTPFWGKNAKDTLSH